MKKEAIIDSLKRGLGLTVGSAGSRVLADKLPIDNYHLKRGGLVLAGALGAAFVGRETSGKATVQDIALGVAATQGTLWIKDAFGESMKDNSLVTAALGSPKGTYYNPVNFRMGYANFAPKNETIDTTYEDVSDVKFKI